MFLNLHCSLPTYSHQFIIITQCHTIFVHVSLVKKKANKYARNVLFKQCLHFCCLFFFYESFLLHVDWIKLLQTKTEEYIQWNLFNQIFPLSFFFCAETKSHFPLHKCYNSCIFVFLFKSLRSKQCISNACTCNTKSLVFQKSMKYEKCNQPLRTAFPRESDRQRDNLSPTLVHQRMPNKILEFIFYRILPLL